MALFESYERRINQINAALNSYGISSIEEAEKITKDAGLDVYNQIKKIQPICFENACWAYIVGAAIAIKKGCRKAADAAAAIGEGLQSFCIPGSVADTRKVGLGHGNLGKMLLEEETECFAFLAPHNKSYDNRYELFLQVFFYKMCVFYEISKKSVSFAGAAHKQIVSYYQQSKYNAHAPEHTFYE